DGIRDFHVTGVQTCALPICERLLAAEQAREDTQRQLYHAHRSVSELAGRLQGQQGRLDAARNRIERIDAELAQLGESIAGSGEQIGRAAGRTRKMNLAGTAS